MELRPEGELPLKRTYQRHDDNCTGSDWAVVEKIVTAGTVDVIPPGDHICDCDRAAVIARLSYEDARIALKVNNHVLKRLIDLKEQLWPASTR